jgi:predicted ATPase
MGSTRLFVLTGAPGSGKTAVIDHLDTRIDRVPEPAREILATQRATGGSGTPQTNPLLFVDLLLQSSIRDHEAAQRSERPTIFDRGVPDCIAYSVVLGVDPGPSIRAADRYRYHTDVLVLEPWEEVYTTDDERTMAFAETVEFHEALIEAYERASYALVAVPRDSIEVRATFLRDFIADRSRGL